MTQKVVEDVEVVVVELVFHRGWRHRRRVVKVEVVGVVMAARWRVWSNGWVGVGSAGRVQAGFFPQLAQGGLRGWFRARR